MLASTSIMLPTTFSMHYTISPEPQPAQPSRLLRSSYLSVLHFFQLYCACSPSERKCDSTGTFTGDHLATLSLPQQPGEPDVAFSRCQDAHACLILGSPPVQDLVPSPITICEDISSHSACFNRGKAMDIPLDDHSTDSCPVMQPQSASIKHELESFIYEEDLSSRFNGSKIPINQNISIYSIRRRYAIEEVGISYIATCGVFTLTGFCCTKHQKSSPQEFITRPDEG